MTNPWGICPRCGLKRRLFTLRKESTGLRVCRDCWDGESPQEHLRGVPDLQAHRNPSPQPAPNYVALNEITADDL